jgi:hypothetical protein
MPMSRVLTAVDMRSRTVWVLLLAACTGGSPRAEAVDSTAAVPPAPADSLVLEGPGDVTVWFTDARAATGADGSPCLERALQIRQDSTRRGVPLLYTREAPVMMGKDAIRAVLYNNCEPVAAYQVDFATISPKRLP